MQRDFFPVGFQKSLTVPGFAVGIINRTCPGEMCIRDRYDTQSLAKFAFSMFWRAMRFAEEQQVPILLDY